MTVSDLSVSIPEIVKIGLVIHGNKKRKFTEKAN
jgi:hypothetical protein